MVCIKEMMFRLFFYSLFLFKNPVKIHKIINKIVLIGLDQGVNDTAMNCVLIFKLRDSLRGKCTLPLGKNVPLEKYL